MELVILAICGFLLLMCVPLICWLADEIEAEEREAIARRQMQEMAYLEAEALRQMQRICADARQEMLTYITTHRR